MERESRLKRVLAAGRRAAGTMVFEFNTPGIGRLLVQAVLEKDFPVVQGIVALTTAAYVLINVAIDIAYGIIDPRVQS